MSLKPKTSYNYVQISPRKLNPVNYFKGYAPAKHPQVAYVLISDVHAGAYGCRI